MKVISTRQYLIGGLFAGILSAFLVTHLDLFGYFIAPGIIFGLFFAASDGVHASYVRRFFFVILSTLIYWSATQAYLLFFRPISFFEELVDYVIPFHIINESYVSQIVVSALGAMAVVALLRMLSYKPSVKEIGRGGLIGLFIGIVTPLESHDMLYIPSAPFLFPLWQAAIAAYCGWLITRERPS